MRAASNPSRASSAPGASGRGSCLPPIRCADAVPGDGLRTRQQRQSRVVDDLSTGGGQYDSRVAIASWKRPGD